MAVQFGYIYKISNDVNDNVYIGSTMRSIELRFNEHCFDDRSTSLIHKAIKEIGYIHFKVEELEKVEFSHLYEREKYWVQFYDSYNNGYNKTPDGQGINQVDNLRLYDQILVIESNIIFDSAESMIREIKDNINWGYGKTLIRRAINTNGKFLDYTLKKIKCDANEVSSIDDRENWIKNLSIIYQGKHIYCNELNMEFETVGQCAKYLYDNNLYVGSSKTPIQSLVTSICKHLKGKIDYVNSINGNLTFIEIPGSTTKNIGTEHPYENKKVKCIELNKEFDSVTDASKYMIDNNYWNGIKYKTAKLRISDIIRGVFPNYKGYSFTYL